MLTHQDVARLVAEQTPDFTAPCPECGHPVGDEQNVHVEGNVPRLLVHCGGSGLDYSGQGFFKRLAWNKDTRGWELY